MDDKQLIDLYFERSETAVSETQKKYGRYCHYIAYNILRCDADAEECVNDAYIKIWNAIPPMHPDNLSAFLGKITRNIALNRYAKYNAEKRGKGQTAFALEELQECLPEATDGTDIADELALKDALNRFLWSLLPKTRTIFMRRYWYMSSIKEIAADYSLSENNVKMILFRTRGRLKKFLEKEGINI